MSPTTYDENNQDDLFSNTVFASDMLVSSLSSFTLQGMTQPLGNPYPKSPSPRNPYEERAPPPDRYDDQHMRPTQPPPGHNGMMREGMSGYPAPSSPAPLYSAPEYNPSSQFPRAQKGRLY
ncbi:unnamed protein product [Coregonus sp. 'balchen']|nr:unnamed protein product [Coregonus sp. 'balchen']